MAGVAPLPSQRRYRVVLVSSCGVAASAASVFQRAPMMFAQQSYRTSSFRRASSAILDATTTVPISSHRSQAFGRQSADLAKLSLLGAFALGAATRRGKAALLSKLAEENSLQLHQKLRHKLHLLSKRLPMKLHQGLELRQKLVQRRR